MLVIICACSNVRVCVIWYVCLRVITWEPGDSSRRTPLSLQLMFHCSHQSSYRDLGTCPCIRDGTAAYNTKILRVLPLALCGFSLLYAFGGLFQREIPYFLLSGVLRPRRGTRRLSDNSAIYCLHISAILLKVTSCLSKLKVILNTQIITQQL
jgi:hypothetical protein